MQNQRNSVAVQEAKFTIFKELMESLFSSFDSLVGVTSFMELSSGMTALLFAHARFSMVAEFKLSLCQSGREKFC